MFSDKLTFTGGGEPVPDTPGVPFGGGYYAGRINIGGNIYALVVAPATLGGQNTSGLALKTTGSMTGGTNSLNDGAANTQAMVSAGLSNHPAAQFCKNLTIGGNTDWYLPSVNELEIAYRNFKPNTTLNSINFGGPYEMQGYNPDSVPEGAPYADQLPARTSISAFIAGGEEAFNTSKVYWTSTQSLTTYNWTQRFDNGGQANGPKTSLYNVRAFRRVLIS